MGLVNIRTQFKTPDRRLATDPNA